MIHDYTYHCGSKEPVNPLCIGSFDKFDAPSSAFSGIINPKGKHRKIVFDYFKFLFRVLTCDVHSS